MEGVNRWFMEIYSVHTVVLAMIIFLFGQGNTSFSYNKLYIDPGRENKWKPAVKSKHKRDLLYIFSLKS